MTPTHAELYAAMGNQPIFIDPSELGTLCEYAANVPTIVEIGCAFGGSSALFLNAMSGSATLTSIDAFVQDSHDSWAATPNECRLNVARALDALGKPSMLRQWTLIHGDSQDVVTRWSLPICLLFVDGSHHYADVRADVDAWGRFVPIGGVMMLHDSRRLPGADANVFNRGWDGPTQVAAELAQDPTWRLEREVYSLTCWRKQ